MADDKVSVEISIEERAALKALTALTKGVDKFEDQTKKSIKKTDAAWASFKGNIAAIAASGALRAIGNGISSLVSGSIEAASAAESLATRFEVLTGSAEQATELFAQLKEFSAGTPFQLQGIAEASAQLLSFGFESDTVRERIEKIGEVAAGSGSDLKEVALIYGQVAAAGKLTGERLLQLQERAVPIGPAIAKTMGIAEDQVREFVSKGLVDFNKFESAFNSLSEAGGKFQGAIAKQSKTLSGVTSTLNDNFFLLQQSIGDAFRPALVAGAETIIGVLQDLNKWVKENQQEFEVWTGFMSEVFENVVGFAGEALKTVTPLDKINDKLLEQDERMSMLVKRKNELKSRKGSFFGIFDESDALSIKKVEQQIAGLNYEMQQTLKQRKKIVDAAAEDKQTDETRDPAGDKKVQEEQNVNRQILAERAKLNEQLLLLDQDRQIQEEQIKLQNQQISMEEREMALMEIMQHEQQKAQIIYDAEAQRASQIMDAEQRTMALKIAQRKKEIAVEQASANAKKAIREADLRHQQQMVAGFGRALSMAAGLAKKGTAEQKIFATAAATINTYAAATRAYRDYPYPANIAVMATTIAAGLAQVKEITKASFATGGVVGGFNGTSMGNDNMTANVRRGEMILNGQEQKKLFDIATGREQQPNEPRQLELTTIVQIDEREIARSVRNQRLEGFAV